MHLASWRWRKLTMQKSNNSIYRWLSKVTDGDQASGTSGAGVSAGAPYTCPTLTEFARYTDDNGLEHLLTCVPAVLESTDFTPQVRWFHSKKRTRDTPTREVLPRDEPRSVKAINEFERKPRPHQSRKPGNFSKGRASSPIKLRDVFNATFSETNLLSRKTPGNGRVSMSAVNERREPKQTSDIYDSFNFRSHDVSKQLDACLTNAFIGRIERIDATRPRHRLSPNKTTEFADPVKATIASPGEGNLDRQAAKAAHESRSFSPYTWSESGRATASLSAIVEDHLLNILHVGLFPKPQTSPEVEIGSKHYYSLHELKMLLEARKESWQSNVGGVEATFQPASTLNSPQKPGTQISHIEEVAENLDSELNVTTVKRNTTSDMSKTCTGDVVWDSQLQRDFNGNDLSNLSSLQCPKVGNPYMTDADAFFRALDAEFCAIMETSDNYLEPARQSSKTQPTSEVDQHTVFSAERQPKLTVDSIRSQRLDRLDSGITHSASQAIPLHHALDELATRPNDPRILPVTSSRQPFSVLTTAPVLKHTTLPSGFWRRNKLY
ncbi:hypothetical protein N7448_010408 [Penicillium atrosanguineum]|uniref:T-complex protein 1 subunit delta n=1 Tax=Penicillium atrosanguineum TaxID=1132637 RepID=UPI00238A9951|nr:T-complex protein 1 subunit delta [Penicillium atrosanguineum]KAJ5119739.1 hypothetical protein N7448_010408 [Penicillium atrosanguineum]KAJ5296740.1 T-complex protein 1 subunit delta [Penicillium atrosanguineum]